MHDDNQCNLLPPSEQAFRPGFTLVCCYFPVGRGGSSRPPRQKVVPRGVRIARTRAAAACREKPSRYAPGADNSCCHDWGPHQLALPLPTYLRRPLKSVCQVLSWRQTREKSAGFHRRIMLQQRTQGESPSVVLLSALSTAQPLSAPLQHGIRFLPPPLPAAPSAHLAGCFPSTPLDVGQGRQQAYHVPPIYPSG